MSDPTLAEVVRRLEDVARSVERVAATMEASYVRKEVYEAKHESLRSEMRSAVKDVADDVSDIKRVREKDSDRWKQAMFTTGVNLLMLLIIAAISVSNFMARGGS